MTLAHLLLRQALAGPQRAAILEGSRPWATHGEWAARSAGLAQRLRAAGLEPRARNVDFIRNHPRYMDILSGARTARMAVEPGGTNRRWWARPVSRCRGQARLHAQERFRRKTLSKMGL